MAKTFSLKGLVHQQNDLFTTDNLADSPATKTFLAKGTESATVVSSMDIMQTMYKAASLAYSAGWQSPQIQDVFAKTLEKVIEDKGADQAPGGIVAATYKDHINPAEASTNAAADKKDNKGDEAPTVSSVRPDR